MAAATTPAISSLKNRKAEAKPITPEERQARIAKAQQLMTEQKINSICLGWGDVARLLLGGALGQ